MTTHHLLIAMASAAVAASTQAAPIITEVHPTGSSSSTYGRDWFEVTNTASTPLDITNWKVDDSSASYGSALSLRGVTILQAGESAIFMESTNIAGDDDAFKASFLAAWFNTTPPASLQIGFYSGSGIGLSSSGDEVNLYNADTTLVSSVAFGAATTGVTFDNAISITSLPKITLTTLSTSGANGAFNSFSGGEIGSPGAIPEPASLAMIGIASLIGLRRRR